MTGPVGAAGASEVTPLRTPSEAAQAWRVQSVDRAVLLLRAVAAAGSEGAGTVTLGQACGLNRATAWRLLSTLESHGLVACDRSTNQWTLGTGLVDIVRSSGLDSLIRYAHEVLEKLARDTGETAALAVLRDGQLVYVDEVVPPTVVTANWLGRAVSLHATSTGKVLLAWSTEDEVARLLPRRLERFTDATITDRASLRADLDLVRRQGYSTCDGEYDPAACGVSAPVLDSSGQLLAIVSVWGPPPRVAPARFPDLGALTMEAAARMAPL
jgi:DNA-binding IclR family transcriptional regulator